MRAGAVSGVRRWLPMAMELYYWYLGAFNHAFSAPPPQSQVVWLFTYSTDCNAWHIFRCTSGCRHYIWLFPTLPWFAYLRGQARTSMRKCVSRLISAGPYLRFLGVTFPLKLCPHHCFRPLQTPDCYMYFSLPHRFLVGFLVDLFDL